MSSEDIEYVFRDLLALQILPIRVLRILSMVSVFCNPVEPRGGWAEGWRFEAFI